MADTENNVIPIHVTIRPDQLDILRQRVVSCRHLSLSQAVRDMLDIATDAVYNVTPPAPSEKPIA